MRFSAPALALIPKGRMSSSGVFPKTVRTINPYNLKDLNAETWEELPVRSRVTQSSDLSNPLRQHPAQP